MGPGYKLLSVGYEWPGVTLLDENPIGKPFKRSVRAEAKHCSVHSVWDVIASS